LFYVYNADNSSPDRADFFTVNDNFSDYHGVYYGDRVTAAAQGTKGTAGLGLGVLGGFDASVPLITAAESYFLQSEAALRGWTSDDAKTLLRNGITANYEFLYTRSGKSVADADAAATAYLVNHATSVNLQEIITQKWAALDGVNNFEAWTEYRRTGFPTTAVLPLTKFPGNTRHIPTKLMYPTSEQNTNQDNYKAAVAQGNDPQSTKVFWMK
jgi:hypothetical protein